MVLCATGHHRGGVGGGVGGGKGAAAAVAESLLRCRRRRRRPCQLWQGSAVSQKALNALFFVRSIL